MAMVVPYADTPHVKMIRDQRKACIGNPGRLGAAVTADMPAGEAGLLVVGRWLRVLHDQLVACLHDVTGYDAGLGNAFQLPAVSRMDRSNPDWVHGIFRAQAANPDLG